MQPGISEIAGERGAEPVAVALDDGPVETVELTQAGRVLGRHLGVRRDHQVHRVARHQPDQRIDDERHQRQNQRRLPETVKKEAGHGGGVFNAGVAAGKRKPSLMRGYAAT